MKAAQLADNYVLVNKSPTREKKPFAHNVRLPGDSVTAEIYKARDGRLASSTPVCFFCKKIMAHNYGLSRPQMQVAKMATKKRVASIQTLPPQVKDPFHLFRSTRTVSLGPDQSKHPVRIVWDTCAAQSLIKLSALPNISDNYTGEKLYLRDFHDPFPTHLAEVELRCGLVQEAVKMGVSEDTTLPIPDADIILGNDFAGSLVSIINNM